MSWRRDLELLHGEEVDMALKPHPLSFIKYHIFFAYLILLAFFLQKFRPLLEDNISLLSAPSFLETAFSRLDLNLVDVVFLVSFWTVLIISGWIANRLLSNRMLMVYVILVAALGTILEIYLSITPFEMPFVQRTYVKLILLAGTAIVNMLLIDIHRRRFLYIVTNYRVIVREGLKLKEEEITYNMLAHIHVEQGILGRLFNFGTVILFSIFDIGLNEPLYREVPELSKSFEEKMASKTSKETSLEGLRRKKRLLLFGVPDPRRVRVIIGNRQLEAKEFSAREASKYR